LEKYGKYGDLMGLIMGFNGIYENLMGLMIVIQWDINGIYPLVICCSLLLNMAHRNSSFTH
jgi:hypothetical protein